MRDSLAHVAGSLGFESFDTFAAAATGSLERLLSQGSIVPAVSDPTSVGSGFGSQERSTVELVGYGFEIRDPQSLLFVHPDRVLRLPFCFGNVVWTWAGSDRVDLISYYNARAHMFSDDGAILRGAFGPRLRESEQLRAIIQRLRADPSSRRTVAVVMRPDDNVVPSKEYPCCLAVQYLVRNGELTSITYMRSQSAIGVLPYDTFLFGSIHCAIARELGLVAGPYRHFSGSFHIYEDEIPVAKRLLAVPPLPVRVGEIDSFAALDELSRTEALIRNAALSGQSAHALRYLPNSFDTFVDQACAIFVLEGLRRMGSTHESRRVAAALPADFSRLAELYIR